MGFDALNTFDEVLATEAAIGWLRSLDVRPGRFDGLLREIADLNQAQQSGSIGRYAVPVEFRCGMFSLIEAMDLCRIHRSFLGSETPGLRNRLREAVSGPRAGDNEPDEHAARGRNFLAELSWAAILRTNGHAASVEHQPDAVTRLPQLLRSRTGVPALTWEVKRPLRSKGLQKLVEKGARQVRDAVRGRVDLGEFDVIGGCVVIVLDHVVSKALPDWHDTELTRTLMSAAIAEWARQQRGVLLKARKDGVAGVVLYWRPLTLLPNDCGVRIPVGCEQLVFFQVRPIVHVPDGRNYVELAREMVASLHHWPEG
jgi:hypothetical protein